MGTPILGTVIAAQVTTGNTDNTFSIGDTNEMQGGHHTVASLAERDAITVERRAQGMTCWVVSSGTGSLYRLIGGIANANWTQEFTSPPPLSALPDVSIPSPTSQQVLAFDGQKWIASDAPSTTSPSAFTYYLDSALSGTYGYRTLSPSPAGGAEVSNAVVITNGSGLTLFSHAYLSSFLNRTRIDAGLWEFNVYSSVDVGDAVVQAAVLVLDSAGTERELFRVNLPDTTTVTPELVTAISTQGSYATDLLDKTLVKFYGTTAGTNPVTLSIYHNGTAHYTHIHTPLSTSHNDLGGLQGGTSNEYYHLTLLQTGAIAGSMGVPGPTNPFITYQGLVVEQGTRSDVDQVLQNNLIVEQGTRFNVDQNLQAQIDQLTVIASSGTGSIKAVVNGGLTGSSLVGVTSGGTVSINSLSAGPGVSLTNGVNTTIISAGNVAEVGYEDGLALEVFQDYAVGTLPVLSLGRGWDGAANALGHSIEVTVNANNQQSKRLVLRQQGEYCRKLSWGDRWLRMRFAVGLRFAGTTAIPNGAIYIAVCSGTTAFSAPNTVDWFGGGYDGGAGYLASPVPLVGFTYSPFLSRRNGVTIGYGQGVGSAGKCFSSTGSIVSVLLGEFTRTVYSGTQTYGLSIQSATVNKSPLNASYSSMIHSGKLHDINAALYGDSAGLNQTYNDFVGPHNAISLVYTGVVPLEVAYLAVTRVY